MLIKGNKLPYIARIRFHLAKRRVLLLQAQKLSRKYNIRILAMKITSTAYFISIEMFDGSNKQLLDIVSAGRRKVC